jgi:imidazolonepropionase-like amidohydrolase
VDAHSDGNEATSPVTAQVWAEHSIWPQDPGFPGALAGGITSLHVLPGSANLIGGRSVTVRNVPARTVQEMKFPGAPHGMKVACGENPKRVYGSRGGPSTRGWATWPATAPPSSAAQDYRRRWDAWEDGGRRGDAPGRDLQLETLAGVLRGDILVQNHCYRADEMATCSTCTASSASAALVPPRGGGVQDRRPAGPRQVSASIWADWWGFKMEALDATNANAAIVHRAGAIAIIHSDDAMGIQRLNQEAAKALPPAARRASRSRTTRRSAGSRYNAAWALGSTTRSARWRRGSAATW